jgi:hypothetical protein
MKCSQPNCENDAAFTYVWPWGQKGSTCEACLPALERTAESLGRPLPTSPVHLADRGTEPPPPASEGLRLAEASIIELRETLELERGKRRELERELERLKETNRELGRQNAGLANQLMARGAAAPATAPINPPPAGESVIE